MWNWSLVLFNSGILRYKYSNHANIDRYQCQKSAALTRKFDFFFNQKTTSKKHPKHPKNRDSQSPFGGEDWHDWPSWLVDVGGIPTPLKNISQLGWLSPIYGKVKFMFQTTSLKDVISWDFVLQFGSTMKNQSIKARFKDILQAELMFDTSLPIWLRIKTLVAHSFHSGLSICHFYGFVQKLGPVPRYPTAVSQFKS